MYKSLSEATVIFDLPIETNFLWSRQFSMQKVTHEQRLPVNNDQYFSATKIWSSGKLAFDYILDRILSLLMIVFNLV